jgi:hypothetical protein
MSHEKSQTQKNSPKWITSLLNYARPLAYASEIGESLRKLYPSLVKPLYGLSIAYVIMDIGIKYKFVVRDRNDQYKKMYIIDLSIWHTGASLVFPAVVINRFVHYTTIYLRNKRVYGNKVIPTFLALCLIPFIIHSIDSFTDSLMDNSYRKYFRYQDYEDDIKK